MSQTMAPPPASPDPTDSGGGGLTVVVTIVKTGDGSYTVYPGDEPESAESGDMSGDDADAMGDAGGGQASSAPQGQPASSIGEALKAAMEIMQADASSEGAPGSAADQFAAGFNGPKDGALAGGPGQKY